MVGVWPRQKMKQEQRIKNGIESFIVYLDNPSQALDTLSFFKKDCGYVKNSTKKVLEKKNIQ